MRQSLLERFKQNGGFLRTVDSLSAAEKYHLRKLIKNGIVSRVKRGLFRLNDSPRVFQETEVTRMIPNGIFCTYTAWSFYQLTTHVSAEYHIAIPRNIKIVLPGYPPVKLYYYGIETFDIGKTSAEINGSLVNVYDLERSVCDAVKFRNKIGTDMLSEILHNYIRRKDKNLDKLLKYATGLRISNTLNQFLQIML
jgi:predicted transcriptional regulator of viral defense system